MARKRGLYVGLAVALGLVGLVLARAPEWQGRRRPAISAGKEESGVKFRLSEGAEEMVAAERLAAPPAAPLSEDDARRVLARLPEIGRSGDDEADFALRESSLPPPRTGSDVKAPFPPPPVPEAAPSSAPGPLEVVRRAPEGEVPLAPHLSVTFSQPMVAVTSHDAIAREAVPVRLTPEPPGQWRWIGTKTVLFEPKPRFPMATDYRVEIPAGTRSALGGTLAQAVRWTFTTPPPTPTAWHPADQPTVREPLLFVAFDQRVEPQAVLPFLRVRAGGPAAPLRLATADEVKADEVVRRLAQQAEEGRWVAFRPESPLPAAARVTVTIGIGLPSAEGPKKTTKPHTWGFHTFGPLTVVEHRCGWGRGCPPLSPFTIRFSNPLDAEAFQQDWVRVEPEVPALRVDVSGDTLQIRGRTKGRTTYRATLSPDLRDAFGQTLGAAAALTFAVGPADPSLSGPSQNLMVLDPATGPRLSVFTVNQPSVKVRIYAVGPEDWSRYRVFRQAFWRREKQAQPPGRLVYEKTVPVQGQPDELTETTIDLQPGLSPGGQAVVMVEAAVAAKEQWQRYDVVTWVQSTRIGLTAFADASRLVAWASDLADGRPLPGVSLELLGGGVTATTGPDGLATLELSAASSPVLLARRGQDLALLPRDASPWGDGSGWQRRPTGEVLRFCVFDDRGMYRPGESARIKGWVRRVGLGVGGDVGPLAGAARRVTWTLHDSQGNQVAKGDRELNAFGGFDFALSLPPTMNLGPAQLLLEADGTLAGRQHGHAFQVQEFRRPEFEVTARANEGPHFVGGHANVTVNAAYYAGGALGDAPVTWNVSARPGTFTPPNRDDFTFGTWLPWWESFGPDHDAPLWQQTFEGRTDAGGRHTVRVDFDQSDPPRPLNVRAEATVMDVNRQAWTADATLLVHPAALYVGLKADRLFVAQGEPFRIDAIVTDLDGKAVAGRPVSVRAERLDWRQQKGQWREEAVERQDCQLTSKAEPGTCTFQAKEGGIYRVTAVVADEKRRPNQSQLRVWVAGGKVPPRRDLEQEQVTLIPDKKEYRAGDTASLLVMAPFTPAEGVLTLRRSGLVRSERFTMSGPTHTLQVRIEEGFTPNLHVQVDLVGAAPRTDDRGEVDPSKPKRPAFASGALDLSIPPYSRTLALAVAPREKALEPGGSTVIDLELKDAGGRPVSSGEVALVVVDEAVLALTGYRLPDPVAVFYTRRPPEVEDRHLRSHVVLARPEDVPKEEDRAQEFALNGRSLERRDNLAMMPASAPPQAMRAAKAKGGAMAEEIAPAIKLRTDFSALALFVPGLVTDASGKAQAALKLPDSLTRYRIMAVAVTDGNRFGKSESTVTARLPLMVRPSPPRFLNFGDRFELPVMLQNQTDQALTVDVAVRATNAELTAGSGRRVTVPANDRVEVRFPAAARRAGRARFQLAAVAGKWTDAAEVDLPVWTPATTEAFATYGQIDQGAIVQPVQAPPGVIPQFGGLEVTTSATALQALTDAVLYLHSYPFECSEQLASRVLAIAALRDVLAAFRAQGLPEPKEIEAAVARDIEKLHRIQNDDGGFPLWRRGMESWPYLTIHVAHALERAQAKGFEVPKQMRDRVHAHLKQIEKHIPSDYGPELRRTLVAYALYVRFRMGDVDAGKARGLVREAGVAGLSFEALGWVLPVLGKDPGSKVEADAIRRHFANRVSETAGTAHFAVSYGDGAHLLLHSDRRADAVVLEALIADQPRSDLIPKIVEGLLGHRRAGRWTNTQENAFVLLALDRYFQTYEKTTPDFVARVWLGERFAGEHAFRGRTTERHHIMIPMRVLAEGPGKADLVVAKEGAGRLYYRIGMRYAPASLTLEPADHGFTVERRYEGVDDPKDVRRDPDGVWHVRAGARVRVVLTMVAPARRYHVALVDPLPAGLEGLNPTLAVTGTVPTRPETVDVIGAPGLGGPRGRGGHWWWWRRVWFDHQNMRDERVEAFSALLFEGVYRYDYVARATTPGTFVVPPSKAEEMYHPETFGRGGTDRVVVE